MDEQRFREQLHHSVEMRLFDLQGDPWLTRRVVAQMKGEHKVNKRFSVVALLMLLLVLVAVTALAIGLTQYFSQVAALEHTYGDYDQWPGSAKIQLVRLMQESGLEVNAALTAQMQKADDTEAEALAEAVLADYFGPQGKINTYNAMLQELGAFDAWTLEDKALYSALLVQYGWQKEEWPLYLLPDAQAADRAVIIQNAKDVLVKQFSALLDEDHIQLSYGKHLLDESDQEIWVVEIASRFSQDLRYRVALSPQGSVLSYTAPRGLSYTAVSNLLAESMLAQPGPWDISEEEAIRIGKESIGELGTFGEVMDRLEIDAYFLYNERFCQGAEPVWLLYFYLDGELAQKMVLGFQGNFLETVAGDQDFEGAVWSDARPEINLYEMDFRRMTLEERAEFSKTWNPVMDAYLEINPYYPNRNTSDYRATRCVYGLPGAGDLTQEQAIAMAREALLREGVLEATFDDREIVVAFDVTDAENPLWKLLIYHVAFEKISDSAAQTDRISYQFIIHARTGKILKLENNWDGSVDGLNI